MIFEVIDTRSKPSIKVTSDGDSFYLHSKYDPVKEAEKWVNGIGTKLKEYSKIIMVGIGAGHHIRRLLKISSIQKIVIFDFNKDFSSWIISSGLVDDIILDKRVSYYPVITKNDLKVFASYLNENILIYQPSLKIFSDEFQEIKIKLENYIIQERTIIDQKDLLLQNFESNLLLNDPGINKFNKQKKTSMILVSAGPSLTKQLPLLKKASISGRFVIGSVGTAFIPLMNAGIMPDFVMIADPKDILIKQFQGCNTEMTTLFYLCSANRQAVSTYKGKRFIVWQEGFHLAEEEAAKRKEPTIKAGGSVATCLLDLMVKFGAKEIALIGQDLAFTEGKSHADQIFAQREIITSASLRKIPNYYQNNYVYTSKNLSVYLNWFERYVVDKNDIAFWNCTEGGAFIKGWIHRSFRDFIDCV